jgi:alkanesulfonate monooxygenase SsuD/methylene tetrahydromethanopterin reductase-like flavin-dependent oxidoreductase (luciferase family)
LYKLWDYTQAEQNSVLDKVDYNGKHYQLVKVSFAPKPYQRPYLIVYFIGTWDHQK